MAFLYDWETAKNVCPSGWHLPSDAEWTILTNYLGGESIAGGKMKESGTTNWESPNADANNKSSFTGLPGGYRDNGGLESGEGTFEDIGIGGNFWSSTEQSASKAWYRYLGNDFGRVGRDYGNKLNGQSVRCIKD